MAEVKTNDMSFETAISSLEELVKKLESGELALDEAMKIYEQGVKLTQLCNDRIKTAKLKIEELDTKDE